MSENAAPGPLANILAELKRRNVVRVALVYLGTAWLIVHVGTVVGESFEIPHWVMRAVILLLALGFPVALGFAWMFEVTPEGVKPTHEVDPADSITHHTGRRLDRIIMIVLALVVLALVVDRLVVHSDQGQVAASKSGAGASVAVLPFVNMSNQADNEPFADGLSEEVLNVLAGIKGLKVAGRTSSFYYKGKNEKPSVIADTLGVNHLLEGSVRWAGEKVRITAQLIDASNGFHLWSQTYDRETTDVFAVQEEIARSVAGALRVTLLEADEARLAKRGTTDAEAHRLYLVARGRLRERGSQNLRASQALFEKAITIDPSYAAAYSGLADTYYLLMSNHAQELQHGEDLGQRAADRALKLDPSSSEAYASRANFEQRRYDMHGDSQALERAIADYRRAIELDSSNAQAYHWYGSALAESDPTGALKLFERAVELDPLMRQAQNAVAGQYAWAGDYRRARESYQELINRYPDFATAYAQLGGLEYSFGHLAEARRSYEKAYELDPDPLSAILVALLSMELGDQETVDAWQPRILGTGNEFYALTSEAALLSYKRHFAEALDTFSRLPYGAQDWVVNASSGLALLTGQPERATSIVLKAFPDLRKTDGKITSLNCDAALNLATGLKRLERRADAEALLNRIAAWTDGPLTPRWPQIHLVRAGVHALRGDRAKAFAALDRAYEEGHRSRFGGENTNSPWPMEDNPAFESISKDPRFTAWMGRIRADNARQLAAFKAKSVATPAT
jgi:TolB-like protein/tetratricopeptide (TPR) repeat protein